MHMRGGYKSDHLIEDVADLGELESTKGMLMRKKVTCAADGLKVMKDNCHRARAVRILG